MQPTIGRTYPPEITALRRGLLDQIAEVRRRYEESPASSLQTATAAASAPRTVQDFDLVKHAYEAEVAPIVKRLADLEQFAILHMSLPISDLPAGFGLAANPPATHPSFWQR